MSRRGSLVTGLTSYWFLASVILQSVRLSVTITDAPVHQDTTVVTMVNIEISNLQQLFHENECYCSCYQELEF